MDAAHLADHKAPGKEIAQPRNGSFGYPGGNHCRRCEKIFENARRRRQHERRQHEADE